MKIFLRSVAVALVLAGNAIQPACANENQRLPRAFREVVPPQSERMPILFHDFAPMPAQLQLVPVLGDRMVVCQHWRAAVSLGKRIGLGMRPEVGAAEINAAWSGQRPCAFAVGLRLRPVAFAVRGDDKGEPICIVRWLDQYEVEHFTGVPYRRPSVLGR